MHWKTAERQERAAVRRIAALLFSLADLADLAGVRALPVRAFVLWLLRPAERVARAFLFDGAEPVCIDPAGNSPEDAARLAQNFRALACALLYLKGVAPSQAGPAFSFRSLARRLAATSDCAAWRAVAGPDTS